MPSSGPACLARPARLARPDKPATPISSHNNVEGGVGRGSVRLRLSSAQLKLGLSLATVNNKLYPLEPYLSLSCLSRVTTALCSLAWLSPEYKKTKSPGADHVLLSFIILRSLEIV